MVRIGAQPGLSTPNQAVIRKSRDKQASEQIPLSVDFDAQADPRFGRHETLAYYLKCARRERNRGLFMGDVASVLGGNSSRYTRQNAGGQRSGLECPEERDYWPYWADSPWKDVAVITTRPDVVCPLAATHSQNVAPKYECDCSWCSSSALAPSSADACAAVGGNWVRIDAHDVSAPDCVSFANATTGPVSWFSGGVLSRVLGTSQQQVWSFGWIVPEMPTPTAGRTCVLRVRLNTTAGDVPPTADANTAATLVKDRQLSEAASHASFADAGVPARAKLGTVIDASQYGRVFQDRSHSFRVVSGPPPGSTETGCTAKTIINVSVRGKRGGPFLAFPSLEYGFTPSIVEVEPDFDCVHVQWTGSDYNPNSNSLNGVGGPPDPHDLSLGRADRHNLVRVDSPKSWIPSANLWTSRDAFVFNVSLDKAMELAFLGQDVANASACWSADKMLAWTAADYAVETAPDYTAKAACVTNSGLQPTGSPSIGYERCANTWDGRARWWRNCAFLSSVATPYFDAGVLPLSRGGGHLMDTRNSIVARGTRVGVTIQVVVADDMGGGKNNTNGTTTTPRPSTAAGRVNVATMVAVAAGVVAMVAAVAV